MPTGYTADFEKQDVSFEEFVWKCVRAFGAFIHQRDEPLNAPLRKPEISTYHRDEIAKSEQELIKYQTISLEDVQKTLDKEYNEGVKFATEAIQNKNLLLQRYSKVLKQVKNWNAPSPDHEGFKKFMIRQLEDSIKFDSNTQYYFERLSQKKQSAEEYLKLKIEEIKHNIKYHTEHWERDQENYKKLITWIDQLEDSVPRK